MLDDYEYILPPGLVWTRQDKEITGFPPEVSDSVYFDKSGLEYDERPEDGIKVREYTRSYDVEYYEVTPAPPEGRAEGGEEGDDEGKAASSAFAP